MTLPAPARQVRQLALLGTGEGRRCNGHAGERETSALLAIRPDLVRRDALRAGGEGMPLERLQTLRDLGVDTGIWWYADHPTLYRGDGTPARADKGETELAARPRAGACPSRNQGRRRDQILAGRVFPYYTRADYR